MIHFESMEAALEYAWDHPGEEVGYTAYTDDGRRHDGTLRIDEDFGESFQGTMQ